MKNMVQQFKLAGLIVTISVMVGVGFKSLASDQTRCVQQEKQYECQHKQSWVSWLRGQSRSSQFHFVDFLELVDRMIPAKTGSTDGQQ